MNSFTTSMNSENSHLDLEEQAAIADLIRDGKEAEIKDRWSDHLAECDECRTAVMEVLDISEAREKDVPVVPLFQATKPKQHASEPVRKGWSDFALVASVIILAGISVWFWSLSNSYKSQWEESDRLLKEQQLSKQSDIEPVFTNDPGQAELIAIQKDSIERFRKELTDSKALLAAAYEDNPTMEEQMKIRLRSSGLEVLGPSSRNSIKYGDEIAFSWNTSGNATIALVIYNNKNIIVHQKSELEKTYKLDSESLLPGVYYWKLLLDGDVTYLGKFYLN